RLALGAESYCGTCQYWGKIKSPVVLGNPRPGRLNVSPGSANGTAPNTTNSSAKPRPDILLNTEITRVVDEGQAALLAMPGAPLVFQRARRLSVIAHGVKPPKWLQRPADAPVIAEAAPAYLTELANP